MSLYLKNKYFFLFETGCHVAQGVLKLVILLPQVLECMNYEHISLSGIQSNFTEWNFNGE